MPVLVALCSSCPALAGGRISGHSFTSLCGSSPCNLSPLYYVHPYRKNCFAAVAVVPDCSPWCPGNGDGKLKHRKFHLNIRKAFFTVSVVRCRIRLPNLTFQCLWGLHPWRCLIGSGCPESLWCLQPQNYLKPGWAWAFQPAVVDPALRCKIWWFKLPVIRTLHISESNAFGTRELRG